MDVAAAYRKVWSFTPPRTCREMHEAGLFVPRSPGALVFGVFEIFSPEIIVRGDAYVSELLVPGLVPIGGDRSGDRWCFDTRERVGGTTPVLACPHDGGGATYVAPSFASFVYRLVVENLTMSHMFAAWGTDRAALVTLTLRNLELVDRWILRRWARRARQLAANASWPKDPASVEQWLREDPAFAQLGNDEVDTSVTDARSSPRASPLSGGRPRAIRRRVPRPARELTRGPRVRFRIEDLGRSRGTLANTSNAA